MTGGASIGVLIPTRNCAGLLPAHVESVQSWADLAAEVVVVDSESTDGTVEYLQKHLRHPRIRFLQHPRGLYQSWNFGLQQLGTKYAYISTVGDSITRAGIEHLSGVLERLGGDVAVSKPRFIDNDGNALKDDSRWPVDDIIHTLQVKEPVRLEGLRLFLFALCNVTGAVLGSSASNLYRTEFMQAHPFPTDFGTVGDGGWSMANVFDYRLCVTSEQFSTFRDHPKAYAAAEYAVTDLNWKLFQVACGAFQERSARDPGLRARAARIGCDELISLVRSHLEWHRRLETDRAGKLPWILKPGAWRARRQRRQFELLMHERKRQMLKLLNGI
jgi:hypothetical protein